MTRRSSFGFLDLGQALAGMGTGVTTFPAIALPRVLRHLPKAVKTAYKRIRQEPTIGPNIKNAVTATLPLAAVLVVPLSAVASVLYGLAAGTMRGLDGPPQFVAARLAKEAEFVDKSVIGIFLPALEHQKIGELEEGEQPYDISPLRGLGAFVNGVGIGAATGPAVTGVYLYHLPNLWWKFSREIVKDSRLSMVLLTALQEALLTKGTILAAPLSLLGGTLYGLGTGTYRAYGDGFRAAWLKALDDVRHVESELAKFQEKD